MTTGPAGDPAGEAAGGAASRRRPWRRFLVVGVVVVVLAAAGTVIGVSVDRLGNGGSGRPRQVVDQRAAAEARAAPGATTTTAVGAGQPVSSIGPTGATLVVPALGVRAPIVATGGVNGSLMVPSDIHEVGWYDGINRGTASQAASEATHTAPWPGQPGVALLAGHVDWAGEGPGALYYLAELQVGDPIQVVGSNGTATTWRVSQPPVTISKSALPSTLFSNTGAPRLAVVTCGGPFDAATGHYLDNVVVWATPTS